MPWLAGEGHADLGIQVGPVEIRGGIYPKGSITFDAALANGTQPFYNGTTSLNPQISIGFAF